MMKQILKLSILLLLFVPWQKGVGQDIIMGSVPYVGDIEDENQPRYFYDPGGVPGTLGDNNDPNGYFAQGLRDTITLHTYYPGFKLYVYFEEFIMGDGDTLWIFDGNSCNAPLLGTYNLVNSPRELYATGEDMTFVFHSDSMDIPGLQDGWKAQVYGYNPNPVSINYGEWATVLTCNAVFWDAGGPNGNIPNDVPSNEFTQFLSPIGTHIKCHFTQFSVNGVLKIYDGAIGTNRRLIGQFCNNTLNNGQDTIPTFFSSTNALCFEYVSGSNDNNKPGWRADITCEAELFEPDDDNPCPSVTNIPGGLYADSPDPKVIEYNCANPVVVLQADVIATGQYTNDYTVKQIEYNENNMLFGYNEGQEISASEDDKWKAGQDLPFTFMFFGKPYQRVWPGTNGLISMSPQTAGSSCEYKYGAPPPSPPYTSNIPCNAPYSTVPKNIPYNYRNCIYGVYEDIDCRYYTDKNDGLGFGAVRVDTLGQKPCRAFVFNYLNVGLYGLVTANNQLPNENYNTYQMVIYEGTSIIDVYVKHRKSQASTNNCNDQTPPNKCGIIGLQNSTSSQILIAPGRGVTTNGWTINNEAWRFTPITPLDEYGSLTWYEDSIDDYHIISYDEHAKTNRIITVRPTDTTMYISEYKYTNAVGDSLILRDTTIVNVNIPRIKPVSSNGETPVCPGDSVFLSVEIDTVLHINPALYGGYTWSTSKADTFAIDTVFAPVGIDTATYYVTLMFENGCTRSDSVKVAITDLVMPTITGMNSAVDTDSICIGNSYILTATHPDINVFKWSTNQTTPSITVKPQITTDYVVSATLEGGCEVTDTFTVVVMPLPNPSFIASPTEIFVENGVGTVTCTNTSVENYPHLVWNFGDVFSNVNIIQDLDDPTHDYTRSGYYTITLTATDAFGCVDSVKARVSVSVPFFFYIPNAFTPDGDGVNETFAPKGEGVDPDHYSMQIFDRSGMLIFSTRNPYDYWDGRSKNGQMCPEGVYVYKILLYNLNEEDKEYTGTVTLVR